MNREIKRYLTSNNAFKKVFIKGEVSRVSLSRKGHLYFSLKDNKSTINCVAYYRLRIRLPFELKEGMNVLITGKVDVYLDQGKYQIDVHSITEDGLGQLYVALEQLKQKLLKEGLFDKEVKKSLPVFPKRIGIVTASDGAAVKDIYKALFNNSYSYDLFVFPTLVQGKGAVSEIVRSIRLADTYGLDCLIVGRGGGNPEDLWTFNHEDIARAVYNCKTPLISAVGHEKDTTLIDYVSDVVASTPTDAGNRIISQFLSLENQLNTFESKIFNLMVAKLNETKSGFELMLSGAVFKNPDLVYGFQKSDFKELYDRFKLSSEELLKDSSTSLSKIKEEYVIRNPCRIQIENSTSQLNTLQSRLIKAMDLIVDSYSNDMDKTCQKFASTAGKLVNDKKHSLDLYESYLLTNPHAKIIGGLEDNLKSHKKHLIKSMSVRLELGKREFSYIRQKQIFLKPNTLYLEKSRDFNVLKNKFGAKSNEIIMKNRHSLDTIKNKSVIRNPCKIQITDYSYQLNTLQSRLIKAMDLQLELSRREFSYIRQKQIFLKPDTLYLGKSRDFDVLKNKFGAKSQEIILKNRHSLDTIKNKSVIRNPCKIQIADYSYQLNTLQSRLIKAVNLIIKSHRNDMDKTSQKFASNAGNLVNDKRHSLELYESYVLVNPYASIIDRLKNNLESYKKQLSKSMNLQLELSRRDVSYIKQKPILIKPDTLYLEKSRDFNVLKNKFGGKSQELILKNRHSLDTIKNKSVIRNPHSILKESEQKLNIIKSKLDNVEKVIELEKDKQMMKAKYTKMIIAIVIIIIIIILIMIFGGVINV